MNRIDPVIFRRPFLLPVGIAVSLFTISTAEQRVEWVEVPPGQFMMGDPEPAIDEWDETPVHEVVITEVFDISSQEITLEPCLLVIEDPE